MKVVKKKTDDGHVRLDVTASTSEVTDALNQAAYAFCNQMGIRPVQDKTPAQVVAEQLGIRDLDGAVANQAIEMLVAPALNKHNIVPAFTPLPEVESPIKRGRTFQFTLNVLPKPSYELEDYSRVAFTAEPFKSDEEAIDRQIGEMASQYTTYVATDSHPIHAGDSCKIKIEAKKDGEVVPGLTTEGRTYSLGQDLMPKGFDEGIDGMEVGETRTFTFEGPGLDADMNEVMEEYEVTVTLLEVQKEQVPVINDEWIARNMPMYNSLADMRADFGKHIDEERRKYYDDYLRNLAATELAKRFKGSIDDEVYEGSMREQQRNLRQQVAASGQTWEQFCEQQGGEQQVGMMLMVSMRQQLVQGYCLDAYYRHYGLSYTEEDLDEACFQINPKNPRGARHQMERNGLGFALREAAERLRACKHLVENAEIKYSEGGMPTMVQA
ncbi:MAG TPA: trigger factor [Eggerthellaceae bacterium]|nr:trigger factor [Eggerthellaceae bacterium]